MSDCPTVRLFSLFPALSTPLSALGCLGTGLVFAAFAWAMLQWDCQKTPEVRPDVFWWYGRIAFHLILISLLIAAVGTDFRDYVVPDQITVTGMAVAIGGATLSGDLQMIHIWVDWNQPLVELTGPEIPEWIKKEHHPHWHGLAWSLAGLLTGGGITWLLRTLSRLILGRPALGFGDVTLMAMIGSFLGWQPTVIVFLLAPLLGVLIAAGLRLVSSRVFLPYAPCLALAALVVIFGWRWIWMLEFPISSESTFAIRRLFGDAVSLAIVGGVGFTALTIMLLLLRLYYAIPVTRRS